MAQVLRGCVARVVNEGDRDDFDASKALVTCLTRLGADTRTRFTKSLTHVVLVQREGIDEAVAGVEEQLAKVGARDAKIVSPLWIKRCENQGSWVPEDTFLLKSGFRQQVAGRRKRSRGGPPAPLPVSLDLNDAMFSSTQALQEDGPVPKKQKRTTSGKAMHRARSRGAREVRALVADGIVLGVDLGRRRRNCLVVPSQEAASAMLTLAKQAPVAPAASKGGSSTYIPGDLPGTGSDNVNPSAERVNAWGATGLRSPRVRRACAELPEHLQANGLGHLSLQTISPPLGMRASLRGRLPDEVRHQLLLRPTMPLLILREEMRSAGRPQLGHVAHVPPQDSEHALGIPVPVVRAVSPPSGVSRHPLRQRRGPADGATASCVTNTPDVVAPRPATATEALQLGVWTDSRAWDGMPAGQVVALLRAAAPPPTSPPSFVFRRQSMAKEEEGGSDGIRRISERFDVEVPDSGSGGARGGASTSLEMPSRQGTEGSPHGGGVTRRGRRLLSSTGPTRPVHYSICAEAAPRRMLTRAALGVSTGVLAHHVGVPEKENVPRERARSAGPGAREMVSGLYARSRSALAKLHPAQGCGTAPARPGERRASRGEGSRESSVSAQQALFDVCVAERAKLRHSGGAAAAAATSLVALDDVPHLRAAARRSIRAGGADSKRKGGDAGPDWSRRRGSEDVVSSADTAGARTRPTEIPDSGGSGLGAWIGHRAPEPLVPTLRAQLRRVARTRRMGRPAVTLMQARRRLCNGVCQDADAGIVAGPGVPGAVTSGACRARIARPAPSSSTGPRHRRRVLSAPTSPRQVWACPAAGVLTPLRVATDQQNGNPRPRRRAAAGAAGDRGRSARGGAAEHEASDVAAVRVCVACSCTSPAVIKAARAAARELPRACFLEGDAEVARAPRVTHLVVGADRRTSKCLVAAAQGAALVAPAWVLASLRARRWLAPERYPAKCYLTPAAAKARARLETGEAGPLAGMRVHIVSPLAPRCAGRTAILEALLLLMGGMRVAARACQVCVLSQDNSSGRAQPPPAPARLAPSVPVVLDTWLVESVETGRRPAFAAHAP